MLQRGQSQTQTFSNHFATSRHERVADGTPEFLYRGIAGLLAGW